MTTQQQPVELIKNAPLLEQTSTQLIVHANILKQVMSAASDEDEPRTYLHGVYIDSKNKCLVATNGHVLAKYDLPTMQLTTSLLLKPFKLDPEVFKPFDLSEIYLRITIDKETPKSAQVEFFIEADLGFDLYLPSHIVEAVLEYEKTVFLEYSNVLKACDEKAYLKKARIALMPHVMNNIAQCFPHHQFGYDCAITIKFHGTKGALICTSKKYPNLLMVAMPAKDVAPHVYNKEMAKCKTCEHYSYCEMEDPADCDYEEEREYQQVD